MDIELTRELTEKVFSWGVIPSDWEESFIINLFKKKGDALDRGNYRGLKLTDQVMKLVERVLESFMREMVNIDEMQVGYMPGRGTTEAIFKSQQLHKKYLATESPLSLTCIDLEKHSIVFQGKVLWWA